MDFLRCQDGWIGIPARHWAEAEEVQEWDSVWYLSDQIKPFSQEATATIDAVIGYYLEAEAALWRIRDLLEEVE